MCHLIAINVKAIMSFITHLMTLTFCSRMLQYTSSLFRQAAAKENNKSQKQKKITKSQQ